MQLHEYFLIRNSSCREALCRSLRLSLFVSISCASTSFAANYNGRFTFGGYSATERFVTDSTGSDKNDVMTLSSRMFLKVSELGEGPWEVVTDLRDKHDFFDKLDREKLQLQDKNSFQVKQMSTRWLNNGGALGASLGRFPVSEAGVAGVDGAQLEGRWSPSLVSTVFGGKNPRRNDQTFFQYNPNSNIAGFSTTYSSKSVAWDKNYYVTHAYVTQTEGGETDRSYLYQNMIFQWEENSRVITLLYLDFVPRTYIQTGNLTWQQQYTKSFASQLSILGVDVIEYTRRQNVREILTPSPYQEASLKLNYFVEATQKVEIGGMSGVRQIDNLKRSEVYLGWEKSQLGGKNFDLFVKFGSRKNFVSDDIFGHTYLGYFSRKWEASLDVDFAKETYSDGTIKNPVVTELSLSNYLSRDLFSTLSFQRATDETVQILSFFFKLGYRFGNREIPPIRDGSPPRGQL